MIPAAVRDIQRLDRQLRSMGGPKPSLESVRRLDRLDLHPGQAQVVAEAARFNVLNCGRRFGKTTLGLDIAAVPLADGQPFGWFAPSYKYLLEVWRDAVRWLAPVTLSKNATDRRIELVNGGLFECWTLDGPNAEDAGRGRKYARIVVDEAAKVPTLERAWQEAIRPTLTDFAGDAYFLSTPKGRNFFHRSYLRGQDPGYPDWMSWTMPSSANPYLPPGEIEQARRDLPDRVFRQEYLAEFLDDGGGVFRGTRRLATEAEQAGPIGGHTYTMGVDWGRHNDFTVLTVFDETASAVARIDRFTGIEYASQLLRLRALALLFDVRRIEAELNSMGGPLVEQLAAEGLPVFGFDTTNASKTGIVRAVEDDVERAAIALLAPGQPNADVALAELDAYEQERLPSGRWRFSAPEGLHDDTVISLALARYASHQTTSGFFVR